MKKYDKYGNYSRHGKYDQYGHLLRKKSLIKDIKYYFHSYKQNKMIIPTDPEFIKKRANEIRHEINEQKIKRIELSKLNEDIELIKFHARIKGKLKLDDLDYNEARDKQESKESLELRDIYKKDSWYDQEDN